MPCERSQSINSCDRQVVGSQSPWKSSSLPAGGLGNESLRSISPDRPVANPVKISSDGDAILGTFEPLRTPATNITPKIHQETPPVLMPMPYFPSAQNGGIEDGEIHGERPDDVHSPFHTASHGVKELPTSYKDPLGPSDAESRVNFECSDDMRKFICTGLNISARRHRRQSQRQLQTFQRNCHLAAPNDSGNDHEDSKKTGEIIPEVRECDLVQFQSRPSGHCHKLHCIDVLIAGHSLIKDIESFKSGRIDLWKPGHVSNRSEQSDPENVDEKWIRRIRINSEAVINLLRQLCPQAKGFRGQSIVFHRPFQILVSLHQDVKEQLTNMMMTLDGSEKPMDGVIRKVFTNRDCLDQLTCFVDFMDRRIMPDSRRYRNLSALLPETIRYEDLWYLLKPGDLVFVPGDPWAPDDFRSTASRQQILRVLQTRLTNTSPATGLIRLPDDGPVWSVLGHFIEHDGASYAPVQTVIPAIQPFGGERKVTDLPVYPISYLEDNQIMEHAVSGGAIYVGLIGRRFGFYSGWTRTVDPYGSRLRQPSSKSGFASSEYIESDILVDFQETFNAFPDWRPPFYQRKVATVRKIDMDVFQLDRSDLPLLEWDTEENAIPTPLEQILNTDQTEVIEAKRFLAEDVLEQFKGDRRKVPTGEYLALLPRRFFAYAVLERKLFQLDTRFVRVADVEANDQAFDRLEIDRNYKQLILSLVKSHFDKIEIERTAHIEIGTQDAIRDKGKGVVILLHGVPGVGKTATAEAVALKWKKPLFPITSGDLGFTVDTLERSLKEIFRLAHHWDCILLLDEVEVILTQRERHDLKRNALVSAFLKALEYYRGIIFLTTNRAGVLDEAIKSRVHLNLYYDHLTENQTVAIFKQHIQRLREIEKQRNSDPNEQISINHKEIIQFARDHFNQNQRDTTYGPGSTFGRWNGRQIRNAFLIASSLVHYDSDDDGNDEDKDEVAEPSRKKQKQLGRSQFEVVAKTTLMYDQYRAAVHSGKSDDHVAFEREERAMSSQPRSPTPVRMKNISRGLN